MSDTSTLTRKLPMYQQIADQLTGEINGQQIPPDSHFTTLDKICERFDTSKITARRAMQELVRKGVVYTKRGGGAFVAQRGTAKASKLISFLFHSIVDDGALPLVIKGAEACARENGYQMLLGNAQGDLMLSHEYVDRLLEQRVDGVLLDLPVDEAQSGPLHEIIRRFEGERIPVVLVQKRFLDESQPMAYVVADNYGGTFSCVEHLCRLGHQRIAGIFDTVNSGSVERMEGYRGALLKCGAAFRSDLLVNLGAIEDCPKVVDQLLAMDSPPTAIFCIHDLVAREVIHHLHKRGVRVPEQMAVAGFDDLKFSQYLLPPLTTVRQPLEQIGREAMSILIQRMTVDFDLRPHVRLETELVVRESCGAHLK